MSQALTYQNKKFQDFDSELKVDLRDKSQFYGLSALKNNLFIKRCDLFRITIIWRTINGSCLFKKRIY